MSNDIVVVGRNRLTDVVPASGVRATIASPTPNQDPDFPLSNILEPQPEKFWKCGTPFPATFDVDLFVGGPTTVRAFGVTRNRQHGGGVGITSVEVFTSTSATYPPSTWTSRGTITLTPADNDKGLLASLANVRQVRFAVAASGRYSCRFWIGVQADYLELGSEGAEVTEGVVRARTAVRRTYVGSDLYGELATSLAVRRRRFRFSHAFAASTAKAGWLSSMGGSLFMLYRDGVWYECMHVDSSFVTERAPGATALDTHGVHLVSRP